jgi:hypothetical protein
MQHLRRDTLRLLSALSIAAVWVGCAGSQDPDVAASPVTDSVQVVDTVVVDRTAEIRELEQRVSLLQLQLLERDAQVSELQRSLNEARQEVVRVMARMQTIATRAEAASAIAEAEIAVNAQQSTRPGSEYLAQARSLLDQASSQFNVDNFGGALYLSGQARRLVQSGEATLVGSEGSELLPNETLFQMPVPVKTLRRSNMREGPGLEFAVIGTLESEIPLTGLSYTSEWMRVRDETGRTGWIFYSLLGARQ